jgi:hypothetical protein
MSEFKSFTVICSKSEYKSLAEKLSQMGYRRFGLEWEDGEDCVTTTSDGSYITHTASTLVSLTNEKFYSLQEFAEEFGLPLEYWLQKLPDGYRERAMSQVSEYLLSASCDSMLLALSGFKVWGDTNEGHSFWAAVEQHLKQGTPLPPLPISESSLSTIV